MGNPISVWNLFILSFKVFIFKIKRSVWSESLLVRDIFFKIPFIDIEFILVTMVSRNDLRFSFQFFTEGWGFTNFLLVTLILSTRGQIFARVLFL